MKFRDFDKYDVFEDGRIFSYSRNKFLKPQTDKYGYQRVWLTDNEGNAKWYRLNRIVYETFTCEPILDGMQVNHIDECKTNNHISNLNLMTPKENTNWGTGISRRAKSHSKAMTNNTKHSKQVGAFKNGELVFTFPSTREGGRNGFRPSHIAACCRGERKTHKGYTWKYI